LGRLAGRPGPSSRRGLAGTGPPIIGERCGATAGRPADHWGRGRRPRIGDSDGGWWAMARRRCWRRQRRLGCNGSITHRCQAPIWPRRPRHEGGALGSGGGVDPVPVRRDSDTQLTRIAAAASDAASARRAAWSRPPRPMRVPSVTVRAATEATAVPRPHAWPASRPLFLAAPAPRPVRAHLRGPAGPGPAQREQPPRGAGETTRPSCPSPACRPSHPSRRAGTRRAGRAGSGYSIWNL
jgi:hypothetical protein